MGETEREQKEGYEIEIYIENIRVYDYVTMLGLEEGQNMG